MPALASITPRFRSQVPFLFAVNLILYLLVLSVHYVVLAFEAFRTAERQQLELQVLTRDAELRALRAQVDPHFLYNCLNSISALTGSDAAAARRMCLLLAEFLRTTLRVSAQQSITMAEELSLAERFLSIEQVRFGARLQVAQSVDEHALVPRRDTETVIEVVLDQFPNRSFCSHCSRTPSDTVSRGWWTAARSASTS